MKEIKPNAHDRLAAKKMLLEQEAKGSMLRLQNNIGYMKGNMLSIAGNEVTSRIRPKNSFVSSLTQGLLRRKQSQRQTAIERVSSHERDFPLDDPIDRQRIPLWAKRLGTIGTFLLPFFFRLGRKSLGGFVLAALLRLGRWRINRWARRSRSGSSRRIFSVLSALLR